MRPHPFLVLALVGALLGFLFAGVSTYDFEQHLDRQVHSVHCSFVPGIGDDDEGGSDCEVTLMSPYSSVLRTSVWGGVPISLAAMGVFAFLLFFGVDLLVARRQRDSRATGFFALATLLPAGTSVVMGYIALSELDAACKLCIGIYVSSALVVSGAVGLWIRARGSSVGSGIDLAEPEWADDEAEADEDVELDASEFEAWGTPSPDGKPVSYGMLAAMFGLGVVFVVVPVAAYFVSAPDHSRFIGTCGGYESQPDPELLVEMGPQSGVPTLEVFDPLCPACRGFEEHVATTSVHDKLARKAILFPLDSECNWMLDRSVHPGACAVSEAVLCADDADAVIEWAFTHQEDIGAQAADASDASDRVRDLVLREFPHLDTCLGSPKVRAKLNRSLRWAVDNELKVLTPQIYVDGVRLCDEDVDLGLEFALSRMIERHEKGTLSAADNDSEGGVQ
jgi:uncharacterized membrane protein